MRQISFRPLCEADSGWLVIWMNSPHVKQWWMNQGSTPEDEMEEALGLIGSDEGAGFIIELNRKPVGYIQYYDPFRACDDGYFTDQPEGALGIDMFIGDVTLTGQGLGPAALRQFCDGLFTKGASRLLIDPARHNLHAVTAFATAGFTTYAQHDSPRWGQVTLMSRTPSLNA